jgi:hypothetical protein
MKTLIAHVKWDTDGEPLEECGLNETVVVVNAPDDWQEIDNNDDILSCAFSDNFGFCHDGYEVEELIHRDGFFVADVGVMFWPK